MRRFATRVVMLLSILLATGNVMALEGSKIAGHYGGALVGGGIVAGEPGAVAPGATVTVTTSQGTFTTTANNDGSFEIGGVFSGLNEVVTVAESGVGPTLNVKMSLLRIDDSKVSGKENTSTGEKWIEGEPGAIEDPLDVGERIIGGTDTSAAEGAPYSVGTINPDGGFTIPIHPGYAPDSTGYDLPWVYPFGTNPTETNPAPIPIYGGFDPIESVPGIFGVGLIAAIIALICLGVRARKD